MKISFPVLRVKALAPSSGCADAGFPRRSSTRAFSLTELIVTIGILGLLASLLLPGLKDMINKGKSGQCVAQLHQIGVIFKMFENDHGYYVPASWSAAGQDTPNVSQTWYQGATPLDVYFNTHQGDSNNNISALAICPLNRANIAKGSSMKYAGYPYFYNANIMVGTALPVVRVGSLNGRTPSSLMILGDSSTTSGHSTGNDNTDYNLNGSAPHFKKSSLLWLDGHVTQLDPATLTVRDFRYAGQYGD